MLTKRIIACLDVTAGRVVKGISFTDLRDAVDPAELARRHAASGADEVVLLDISATHENRTTLLDTVRHTAQELFIPFTVGGGIRTLDDAAAVFEAGADKISINSAAVARPQLVEEIAARYGSQAVIVAIDAAVTSTAEDVSVPLHDKAEVMVSGGRIPTGRKVVDWAAEVELRGAGEILLTSMRQDGRRQGFDCKLTALVAQRVNIPVIASGGAGSPQHFVDVFQEGNADAALAASIFHFGTYSVRELKAMLCENGIPVRSPC